MPQFLYVTFVFIADTFVSVSKLFCQTQQKTSKFANGAKDIFVLVAFGGSLY